MANSALDQQWSAEYRTVDLPGGPAALGVFIVAEDGTEIAVLRRPDHGSDMLMAGYICGLQAAHLAKRGGGER